MAITQIKGSNIADGTVVAADVADGAVTGAKIAMGSDAAGDVLTYNGTDYIRLAKGTAAQVLKMNAGATAVEWATDAGGIAVPGSSVRGDTLYHNGTVYTRLAKGSSGQVLTMGANDPAWAATAAGGKVVQVVHMETGALASGTTIFYIDDTIPPNTEGDEFLTLAVTPTSATNKLIIQVTIHLSNTVGTNSHMVGLWQDSTSAAIAVGHVNMERTSHDVHTDFFQHYMTAGTTSATTFKVRAGSNGAGTTCYMNGQSGTRLFAGKFLSQITIWEIAV